MELIEAQELFKQVRSGEISHITETEFAALMALGLACRGPIIHIPLSEITAQMALGLPILGIPLVGREEDRLMKPVRVTFTEINQDVD